eukprot:gene4190-8329_t
MDLHRSSFSVCVMIFITSCRALPLKLTNYRTSGSHARFISSGLSSHFENNHFENNGGFHNDVLDSLTDFEEGSKMISSTTSGKGKGFRFGKNLDDSPALVLNANFVPLSYLPLSLWHWQDSLRAVLSDKAVALHYYDLAIRSVSISVNIPSVIVLKKYQKTPERIPPMTRRNGGKLSWTNTVSCCLECNHKKGAYLPQELSRVGMKLRTLPRAPTHYELQYKAKSLQRVGTHPSWDAYI